MKILRALTHCWPLLLEHIVHEEDLGATPPDYNWIYWIMFELCLSGLFYLWKQPMDSSHKKTIPQDLVPQGTTISRVVRDEDSRKRLLKHLSETDDFKPAENGEPLETLKYVNLEDKIYYIIPYEEDSLMKLLIKDGIREAKKKFKFNHEIIWDHQVLVLEGKKSQIQRAHVFFRIYCR